MDMLIVSIICYILKDVFNHLYGVTFKSKMPDIVRQNAIAFMSAFCVMLPYVVDSPLSQTTLMFGVLFGICYALTNVTVVLALCKGPAGPVSMIVSLGSIGGVVYGVVACGESIHGLNVIGIAALLVSVALLNPKKEEESKKETGGAWYFCAIAACFLNGVLTLVKKAYIYHQGESELMVFIYIAFLSASILLWCICLGCRVKKTPFLPVREKTAKFMMYTVLPGICVAGATISQLLAITVLPAYIVYSVSSAGINAMMCFISVFIFREMKFNVKISLTLVFFIIGIVLVST